LGGSVWALGSRDQSGVVVDGWGVGEYHRLRRTTVARFFTNCLLLALLLWPSGVLLAQSPMPSEAEDLLADAAEQAREDVRDGVASQSVQDLELLFGERVRQTGVERTDLLNAYRDAYRVAAEGVRDPWAAVRPSIGWIVAVVLLVVLALRDQLKKGLSALFTAVWEFIYARLAGRQLLRRNALRRYRTSVRKRYERLKIPFRPDRPLDMREVFTPLRLTGSGEESDDVQVFLRRHRRMVVLGQPGAGKSMLLKSIVLAYADDRLRLAGTPVPVLLELSRLNTPGPSVESLLVDMFAANDFPRAERFVRSALGAGQLLLLFDGLDEVGAARRPAVVEEIRKLLADNKCPALITCRTHVYEQQFLDETEGALHIQELVDRQIRRFLGSWERFLPAEKSIEQLLGTLYARPHILALARNPLLLTIMAYLYTDTDMILPHSRAEFYDQAADVLLRQWKQERNSFRAADKRHILEHVALFNQTQVGSQPDRLSIERSTVLARIVEALPDVNLEVAAAAPLLDEIIERSGLLLAIDGGERYQFAHLTVQEFFAASALRTKAGELLRRFGEDPGAWREVVSLWCGLDVDATAVVAAVHAREPVMAYACLGDARKLDSELAGRLLADLQTQLGAAGATDEALADAYGSVAASDRPRGREAFAYLREALSGAEDVARCTTVTRALSFTNLAEAAQLLAKFRTRPGAREALIRMGNLAVGPLIEQARAGMLAAFDDLRAVGTPQSALGLVPLLWDDDETLAGRAAWYLAALLLEPGVEDALRSFDLTTAQRKAKGLSWVWEPFAEPHESALPCVAGRIAYLMERGEPPWKGRAVRLETRLVFPLLVHYVSSNDIDLEKACSGVDVRQAFATCGRELANEPDKAKLLAATNLVVDDVGAGRESPDVAAGLVDAILQGCASGRVATLVSSMRSPLDLAVLAILGLGKRRPVLQDWKNLQNLSTRSAGQFAENLAIFFALLLTGLAWAGAGVSIVYGPVHLLSVSVVLAMVGVSFLVCWKNRDIGWALGVPVAATVFPIFILEDIYPGTVRRGYVPLVICFAVGSAAIWFVPVFLLTSEVFILLEGPPGTHVPVIVGIYLAAQGFAYWQRWRDYRSANPLHSLITEISGEPGSHQPLLATTLRLGPLRRMQR
jgi:hypothetical protein